MGLSSTFRSVPVPETGREAIQLTEGPDYCYPLYYFIPSIAGDGRFLVYHRERVGGDRHDIQLHRLDLTTGEDVQITRGTCEEAEWKPWGADPARGVLGDRSALSAKMASVVYFDGNVVRCVGLHSMEDLELFRLPEDRYPLAQNCFTGDGEWFVYVHVDRERYHRLLADRLRRSALFRERARTCEATQICAYNITTAEHRVILRINYPVHHIHGYGATHLVFSHIPGEKYGIGFTDIDGDWYSILRPQDECGGKIIHHVPTARGIAYEVAFRDDGSWAGLYEPSTHRKCEWPVPEGASHTGCDPAGRLFFYHVGGERIQAMVARRSDGGNTWRPLCGQWPTYGRGQKAHFHPRLVLDRQWMQMVAGDPRTQTNHIFLVNVSDVGDTQGVPDLAVALGKAGR